MPGVSFFNKYCLDIDAKAFITATGISSLTQINAIDKLVKGLKGAGLWSKMYAIYPIVGGSATTHKYNLKDPRDLDAAFRLVFSGTVTHSSSGMVSNGSSGFANTKLTPSATLSLNNTHLSMYSRTAVNDATAFRDMGVSTSTVNNINMLIRFANNHRYQVNSNTLSSVAAATAAGLYVMNRVTSTDQEVYMNGVSMATAAIASSGLPSLPIYLMALNNNGATTLYSTRQYAFTTIGQGLTSGEASSLYTIVQAFQTTLGRQV